MNFQQEFKAEFGDKYDQLQLKNVVVKKGEGQLVITFLYPSTIKELSDMEKLEITNFIKDRITLEKLQIKVKFMRVFLEERLILKAILTYFENKYKLVTTYLSEKNFSVKITNIDVLVEVSLSSRMQAFFEEHKIASELAKFLKENFLVEFVVSLKENAELIDEVDIENVEMKTFYKPNKRFSVTIDKEVIGKDLSTRPQYLSFINSPTSSVVVAGFIKKLERRDFIVKSGKNEGKQKAYYTFQLNDGKGKIDCIYFCSKAHEKDMEALEECMFVLICGDVKLNKMGKLSLQVSKLALASKIEEEKVKLNNLPEPDSVVEIEKLTALEQDSMFELKNKYNNKISGRKIVVFDIETTGLDPNTDQIIELGAVKLENGNIVEKFSTFVKPTKKIPYEVEQLTGISEDMVANAPPIEYVIKDFYKFTRDCVLCGHNVINFDVKFIRREGENVGLVFDNELIDTMNEARVSRLKISRFNLGTVVKALGLTLEGAHRAWNDAFATAQVLLKLNEV